MYSTAHPWDLVSQLPFWTQRSLGHRRYKGYSKCRRIIWYVSVTVSGYKQSLVSATCAITDAVMSVCAHPLHNFDDGRLGMRSKCLPGV